MFYDCRVCLPLGQQEIVRKHEIHRLRVEIETKCPERRRPNKQHHQRLRKQCFLKHREPKTRIDQSQRTN